MKFFNCVRASRDFHFLGGNCLSSSK